MLLVSCIILIMSLSILLSTAHRSTKDLPLYCYICLVLKTEGKLCFRLRTHGNSNYIVPITRFLKELAPWILAQSANPRTSYLPSVFWSSLNISRHIRGPWLSCSCSASL